MKLMWGDDQIGTANSGTRFVWGHTARKNAAGFVMSLMGKCTVTDAVLLFDGQAAAKTAMDALYAASKGQRRNLRFLNDDNTASTNSIDNSATEGGVYWDALTWTDAPGGQFATFRQFTAEFSWEVVNLTSWQQANVLMDYGETVTIEGGLNAFVTHRPVNRNTAVQQVTTEAKVWTVTVSGFAVGWGQLPSANAPPSNTSPPLKAKRVTERSGERTGDNVRRRRVEWTYQLEYVTAPSVSPAQWTTAFTQP